MKIKVLVICLIILLVGSLRYFFIFKPIFVIAPHNNDFVNMAVQNSGSLEKLLQQVSGQVANTSKTEVLSVDDIVAQKAKTQDQHGGQILDYTQEKFEQGFAQKKKVVLVFCDNGPTCEDLKYNLNISSEKIPQQVLILTIDFDKEQSLLKTYNVSIPNTVVYFDDNGQQSNRKSMGITELNEILVGIK